MRYRFRGETPEAAPNRLVGWRYLFFFTLSRRYFLDKNIFVCYLIFAIGYLIVEPPLRIFPKVRQPRIRPLFIIDK